MTKILNRPLKLCGQSLKPGETTTVTVLEYDSSDLVLKCSGASVPSSEAGYAVGCEFINTSTGHLYVNQGSTTSCTFNDVGAIAASEISLAEGSILVGNASGVGVALNAKTTTQILVGNGTTLTSVALSGNATMTNAGVVTVTAASGVFAVGGKFSLYAIGSAAASASGLLMGIGTTANPALTSSAGANMTEIRAKTTATSGDNRLDYRRYEIAGAGASGECIRALTKVTAAAATVRGAHISLDVDAAGSATGLGVGVDAQLALPNAALTGGTYAAMNVEAYAGGASTAVAGVTRASLMRVGVNGDSTGMAEFDDNGFALELFGLTAGSGNIINTDITTHTAYGGLKVYVPGVGTRYIALVSN